MIIRNNGVLQLLVTSCTFVAVVFSTHTTQQVKDNLQQASKFLTNGENTAAHETSEAELVKSHKRATRFDTAASSPWVRVYNRPPGTRDSYYNYETRGNTSAHTSGEAWETYLDDVSDEDPVPIKRSDGKVKDFLRVKPKTNEATQTDVIPKSKNTTETVPTSIPPTTRNYGETISYPPAKDDAQKKEYIVWSSNDSGSNSRVTVDQPESMQDKKLEPPVGDFIPKYPNHWKVVGDGGDEGWQVVDDKGEVEWKIEYDDGEWRVISTGDVPADVEWIDPEYVWGPQEADDRDYNSWPADDYRAPSPSSWKDPEAFLRGISNESWPQETGEQYKNDERSKTGWKSDEPIYTNEKRQFGIRQKGPTKTAAASSVEERTSTETSGEGTSDAMVEDKPQNDQQVFTGNTWVPESYLKNGQKWVQGYGSKTLEGDNTGWNAETGGETWVATNKQFASDPWIPKVPGSKSTPQKMTDDENTSNQDNSVRAWGTGYGSKTWKGNEWNSNVVWKTGFNSGPPLPEDNSTWTFPEQSNDNKKPEVWSQPIPSYAEHTGAKNKPSPTKKLDGIRVKWPTKPINKEGEFRKSPPSRRTESESWSDDDSIGSVVWKVKDDDASSMPVEDPSKSNDQNERWQNGGWKVSTSGEEQKTTVPWKSNPPSKISSIIGPTWKVAGNPPDSSAITWNQGQWPDVSAEPTWIFRGCKLSLKCGGSIDAPDDSTDKSIPPDTADDSMMPVPTTTTPAPPPVNIGKVWPSRPRPAKGKSWKPPSKSWRPPKWKQPTSAPTPPETMSPPTMTWKSPPAPMPSYKKPTPPPDMWKQPPSTMWPETTSALPDMSWKPPSPPMKWKKGPKPTKSWKPPPTKSWRPQKRPNKTWQPSIATPAPDMWPPATKPDCKDTTPTTTTTQAPPQEDDDDLIEPPQIIIITKLPKGSVPEGDDKNDNSDDTSRKPPFGPWIFPPRKNVPKTSSNRKDKNIPIGSRGKPNHPTRNNYRPPYRMKGWPKDVSPPKFYWPNNAMRRWTTKKPRSLSAWRSKYSKSRTWRQMLRRLMNGW